MINYNAEAEAGMIKQVPQSVPTRLPKVICNAYNCDSSSGLMMMMIIIIIIIIIIIKIIIILLLLSL